MKNLFLSRFLKAILVQQVKQYGLASGFWRNEKQSYLCCVAHLPRVKKAGKLTIPSRI